MKKSTNHLKYVQNDVVRTYLLKNFLKVLARSVQSVRPKTLLDVGCGEGFVLQYLKDSRISSHMEGIDMSTKAIKVAQRQVPSAQFSVGDIHALPYKDASYDLVLCTEVLEHLDNPDAALGELMRVSKDYLICSVPHEPWFMLGSLAGGKYISRFGNHPEHVNHWNSVTFARWLRRHGLHVSVMSSLSTFPWILALCRKQHA